MAAPAHSPLRHPDGYWICNITVDCAEAVVTQWAHPVPTGTDPDATVPAMACGTHAAECPL
jgi:hypothetical protein